MKVLKILLPICVALLVIAIFSFSAQPSYESDSLSIAFTEKIVRIYQKITNTENDTALHVIVDNIHAITRKYAHFVLYTLLGLLSALLFTLLIFKKSRTAAYICTFIFCVLYAISDEYHQTFVLGRSGEVRDVLIDSLGSLSGILIAAAISKLSEFLKKRPKSPKIPD